MRCRVLDPDDVTWRCATETIPHDVYHRGPFLAIEAERLGGTAMGLVVSNGVHRLALPLVVRPVDAADGPREQPFDATSAYGYPGPVADTKCPAFVAEALACAVDHLRTMGLVSLFVRLHPLVGAPFEAFGRLGELVVHGSTVAIDLRRPAEALWKDTRSSHRHEIQRAQRRGWSVEVDTCWTHLSDFKALYQETMRRVGASAEYSFSDRYFDRLHSELGDAAHLLVARNADGDIAAGAIFTESGGVVQYHLSGTSDQHLRDNPAKLILFEATRWAQGRGNRWLHLGGGVGAADDSLFRFKLGFSKLTFPYGTWRVILDERTYHRLSAARPAACGSGFFPAYRIPVG